MTNYCNICNRKVYEDDHSRLTAEGKTYIVCLPCVNDYEGLKSIRADLKKQIDELESRIHNYTGTRAGENCENVIGIMEPLEHKLAILKDEYEAYDHITELARVIAYWKKEAENDPDFDPLAPFE